MILLLFLCNVKCIPVALVMLSRESESYDSFRRFVVGIQCRNGSVHVNNQLNAVGEQRSVD